jgi:nucleotide-binding universal stress UspA family protein
VIRTILVPLDGSATGESALPLARALAQSKGAALHLAYVHDPSRYGGFAQALEALDPAWPRTVRDRMATLLETTAEALRAEGLACVVHLVEGPVAERLKELAAETEADLIVMTTHGLGGLSRSWLGSVADALVRGGNAPVLLVRPDGAAPALPRHILLPVEADLPPDEALRLAEELGAPRGARFTLMEVLAPPPVARPILASVPVIDDAAAAEERRRAAERLDAAAGRLRSDGGDATTITKVQPSVSRAILECARQHEADLIVMSTHGRGGLGRLLLGSVTDKVLRGADVPVLVVRPAR